MIKIFSSKLFSLFVTGITLLASTGGAVKLSNEVDSYRPSVPELKRFSTSSASENVIENVDLDDSIKSVNFVDDTNPNLEPVVYVNPEVIPTSTPVIKATTRNAEVVDTEDEDQVWEFHKEEMEKEWESAKKHSDDAERESDDTRDSEDSESNNNDSYEQKSEDRSENDADDVKEIEHSD